MDGKAILAAWNLQQSQIKQIYATTWQVDEHFILKHTENKEQLQRSIVIMHGLSQLGIPVALPIPTITGEEYLTSGDSDFWLLMNQLPGDHIQGIYEGDSEKTAYRLGEILAELHQALRQLPVVSGVKDHDFTIEMSGWVYEVYQQKAQRLVPSEKVEAMLAELKQIYPQLPRQLIHVILTWVICCSVKAYLPDILILI